MKNAARKAVVVIAAHNESRAIVKVVDGAMVHLPVLVVDDASTDDTAALAERAGATVLRQTPNQGQGAAQQAGFRWVLERDWGAAIALDGDGQHDPAEIPLFLDLWAKTDADLIIGARDFLRMPRMRRLANSLGRWSFSWAMGQPIPDNQSGYRLLSRRLMLAVLNNPEKHFGLAVETIATCVQSGYVMDWVPIRTIYAGEQSHIQPFQHVVEFTRLVLRARRRMRRGSGGIDTGR
jgi:glycosyltransferase involved in cell wall biosynthesis